MRAWLWHHLESLGATLVRLARSPLSTLFNVAVIGVALALPLALHVVLANVSGRVAAAAAEPRLTVFLELDARAQQIEAVRGRLGAHPGVRGVRFVPRDEALRELARSMDLGDLAGSLPRNPLPDAFVVEPAAAPPEALERLRDELGALPGVAHVRLDAEWARRLHAALAVARAAVWVLGALFAFALVAVSFNTIRLQILTRREEIEVSTLIGATDAFIRRPFLYFGALQGLAGGLAAWAIVWAALRILNGALAELGKHYATRLELAHLDAAGSLALLALSAALGWVGAWLSVTRHLARLAPR